MKKILLLATIFLLCGVASAQQTATKQAHADVPVIKMSVEDSAKLAELAQASKKYADDNAKLLSAWKDIQPVISAMKDYNAQQAAFQTEFERCALRAAIAAHLTLEQFDNSDLRLDDKGVYELVQRPKADTSKPKTSN